MFHRKAYYGMLMLSLQLAGARQLMAQGAPDPTTLEGKRAEGKARYERGVEAYSAGRFKDAIDLFLQADSLAPSAALSFNIARAYEKIGDDAASLQWYRDFRRRAPEARNGPEVDGRIHALEGVLAKKGVQQLTIFSRPAGATVILDGQPLGVTPFTGQLPPGHHQLVLSLRGYADSTQTVELAADRARDWEVTLVPAADRPVASAGSAGSTPPAAVAQRGEPPVERRAGPRFGPWPWVGIGTGAAVLGGALGFELARRSAEEAAEAEPTQVGYKEKLDTEQSRQTTARILAAAGGVLVVTGGTLLVIDLSSRGRSEPARTSFGGACLPGACGFSVQGRF